MSTVTQPDFSLALPADVKETAQTSVNLWVGMTSPLWVPFWAAASFGLGIWAVNQGLSRTFGQTLGQTLGGTLYDKDLPLAAKWPGFAVPPTPEQALEEAEEAVVEVTEAAQSTVAELAEVVVDSQIATIEAVQDVAETVEEAVTPKAKETALPLLDPVTEMPVEAIAAKVSAEPKLPKPSPRRKTRK